MQGVGVSEHPSAEVYSSFSFHVILKMIATSGFLSALEYTKYVFGRGGERKVKTPLHQFLPTPLTQI